MNSKVLRLNKAGTPIAWLSWQETATLLVKDQVLWSIGDTVLTPALSNSLLFARDQHLCMYCGSDFPSRDLSRDHVMPTSRGGRDVWTNCVTATEMCWPIKWIF